MSMKIGFITERMLLGFGVDLVIHQTASGLARKGHEVTVFPSISDGTYENKGHGYRIVPLHVAATGLALKYEYNAAKKISFLNTQDIDVFFIETYPFFGYSLALKKPVVIVDHGVSLTTGFPLKIRLNFCYISFMQRYLYFARAKRVCCVSRFITHNYPFYLKAKTRVIYNGTDHYLADKQQQDVDVRSMLGIPRSNLLMLYVGRLNADKQPYKGTSELVRNFRRIRERRDDVNLLMVGFGDEKDKRELEKQGVHVMLNAPAHMMKALYQSADMYVSCSKWEGFNLPAAEAQTAGIPVVLYNVGAHPEVTLPGKSAFLVENPDEFVAKTLLLAEKADLRRTMGQNAHDYMLGFTWAKACDSYETIAGEVLEQ